MILKAPLAINYDLTGDWIINNMSNSSIEEHSFEDELPPQATVNPITSIANK